MRTMGAVIGWGVHGCVDMIGGRVAGAETVPYAAALIVYTSTGGMCRLPVELTLPPEFADRFRNPTIHKGETCDH